MNNLTRCDWANFKNDPLYQKYHDEEWGVPIFDDNKIFEYLTLESAQAGLSWLTILRKRQNYRQAYDNFNVKKVAKYDDKKIAQLMQNEGIVRYLPKIEASINNAKKFIEIQQEFGSFSNFQWSFVNHKTIQNNFEILQNLPSESEISKKFHKELKSRGFKFLGPVTCYAHMQACGMVNDHLTTCFKHSKIKDEKKF
jgi:DNA-3-methyladenine glycosylase I